MLSHSVQIIPIKRKCLIYTITASKSYQLIFGNPHTEQHWETMERKTFPLTLTIVRDLLESKKRKKILKKKNKYRNICRRTKTQVSNTNKTKRRDQKCPVTSVKGREYRYFIATERHHEADQIVKHLLWDKGETAKKERICRCFCKLFHLKRLV